VGFSNGVHGGTDDRDIESDISTDMGLSIRLRRNNIGAGRRQQHVIEGKSFWNWKMDHKFSQGRISILEMK
jgi:hypothetical protein